MSDHRNRWHQPPSFSSLLLDSISRSITSPPISPPHNHHIQTNKQTKTKSNTLPFTSTVDLRLRRSSIVHSWINQNQSQPSDSTPNHNIRIVRQQSVPLRPQYHPSDINLDSSTTTTTTTCSFSSKIRTPRAVESCFRVNHAPPSSQPKVKTKSQSRTFQIYRDFNKSKPKSKSPPVSPCKRIATFLNSIFRNSDGNPASKPSPPPSETSLSSCSSCLSKTTSSIGKSSSTSNETQCFTMRHYLADVIAGEKIVNSNSDEEREIKKSQNEFECEFDDSESCSSSDLFELENLSLIGVDRYCAELPLYATTSLVSIT